MAKIGANLLPANKLRHNFVRDAIWGEQVAVSAIRPRPIEKKNKKRIGGRHLYACMLILWAECRLSLRQEVR